MFPDFYPARVLSVPAETHVSLNVNASGHAVYGMNKHVRF